MDWSPHVLLQIPPEGGGLGVAERGVFFLELVSPSTPAPLCNHCRKVLAPRTNLTFRYLLSSHRALENLSVASRIAATKEFLDLPRAVL